MKNLFYRNILLFLVLFIILLFSFRNTACASHINTLPVITVINPIRGSELGHEKDDLLQDLKIQWQYTHDAGVNATWLWQYGTLENDALIQFAKNTMTHQEFGVLLEIDRNFAAASGVQYRGQGPWYFSDGLLLVSYDTSEREKLIDMIFDKFKKTFGYYPKAVGAWWIGADSLVYMQKKYGITAALRASDQFDVDVYSIWGTPWSIPYAASTQNEGVPAQSFDDNSKVVILQWAPRDPTRGYTDFAYSAQDFALRGNDFSYITYLSSVFLQKPLDDMVLGLENSNPPALEVYYKKIVQKAKELENIHKARILLANEYAQKFLQQKNIFADSPHAKFFLAKDYTSNDQSFWYNTANFRAGIIKNGDVISLIDLRDYTSQTDEDFSLLSNSQGYLRVTTPAIIDSIRFPDSKVLIAKNAGTITTKQQGNTVLLFSDDKNIAQFTPTSVKLFLDTNKTKTYTFNKRSSLAIIFQILLAIYVLYFVLLYTRKKQLALSLLHLMLLLIPLLVAYPFLNTNGSYFIFDRKELLLLSLFAKLNPLPIPIFFFIVKLVPFILLLVFHYVFMILLKKKNVKIFFYILFCAVAILYLHTGYFPLDRSMYRVIFLFFLGIFCIALTLCTMLMKKTGSKKLFICCVVCTPVIMAILGGIVYVSRTKIILAQFEMSALDEIKNRHKNVLFVSETDYNIKPIYKAVKPMLYENYRLGATLTGTHWQIITRSNGKTQIPSNYENTIIVVPRYLGADFSKSEMETFKLKKIFDNAQIALFEK